MKKYFGTDGIRGKVGSPPISADWMLKLGWAIGTVLSRNSHGKVVIGKDTRISGYMFESALEAGLVAAGCDVCLLGPMPTPGVAYLTRTLKADLGIVISASHNPYTDNGIKLFSKEGTKISDELEIDIEKQIEQQMQTVQSNYLGKAARIDDAQGRYIEFCKSSFPKSIDLKGVKVVLDCSHGATYHVAPHVFRELGADVIAIDVAPNGLNINHNCGSNHPENLSIKVLEHNADFGIAFDGDGDRVIFVDHTGCVVDGDEILYIITKLYAYQEKNIGGVVGTVMSNLGLENAIKSLGLPFFRSKVGDRHVAAALYEKNWLLGGESSGHMLCLDMHSTGDGIISALQVLSAVKEFSMSLNEIKKGMRKYPQILINIPVKNKEKLYNSIITEKLKQLENKLADNGRILLRASGTEDIVRIMVEGTDVELIRFVADQLKDVVTKELAVC